jgi:MFS family permease
MKPRLLPLYLTNFLGVLDDNLLKSLISLVAVYWVSEGNESIIIMLAAGFMVIPFILFSPYAGFLSKTLNKRKTVIILKIAEIFIMAIASTGFWFENIYIVMIAMFLMGLQSTFFSPMKFSLVRDIGGVEKSSVGTGAVEMTTFFGVLMGTFVAGILADQQQERFLWIVLSFLIITLMGLGNSLLIRANEQKPLTITIKPLNFLTYIRRKFIWSRKTAPGLNDVVIGLSMFWLAASLIQMNLFVHCPKTLGMSSTETGITLAFVAVAIGLGSFLSGVVSGKRVEPGLIPLGGFVFITSLILIFILKPHGMFFQALIMIAAFSAGFFKTPLNAWMQVHVKGRQLGDAIAYNNLINFIFILISAGIFGLVETAFGSTFVFLVVSCTVSWHDRSSHAHNKRDEGKSQKDIQNAIAIFLIFCQNHLYLFSKFCKRKPVTGEFS